MPNPDLRRRSQAGTLDAAGGDAEASKGGGGEREHTPL